MKTYTLTSTKGGQSPRFSIIKEGEDYGNSYLLKKEGSKTILTIVGHNYFSRQSFISERYVGHGTLQFEDMENQIIVKGKESLVFELNKERSDFYRREGTLVYENKDRNFEIIVREDFEWDEF
jgi:hypothetical protein